MARDFPTWLCLWRVVNRTLAQLGSTREDLPEGFRERFDPKLFRFVAGFRWAHRPRLLTAVGAFPGTKHVLTGPSRVRHFLTTLPSSPLPPATPAE